MANIIMRFFVSFRKLICALIPKDAESTENQKSGKLLFSSGGARTQVVVRKPFHVVDEYAAPQTAQDLLSFKGGDQLRARGDMDGKQLGKLAERQVALDIEHAVGARPLRGAQLLKPHGHALRRRLAGNVAHTVPHLRKRLVAHVHELIEQIAVLLEQVVELTLGEREQDGVARRHETRLVSSDRGIIVVLGRKSIAGVAPEKTDRASRLLLERRSNLTFFDVEIVQIIDRLRARAHILAFEKLLLPSKLLVFRDFQLPKRLRRHENRPVILHSSHTNPPQTC